MTEKSEARRDGGKMMKNSGRGYIQKGDYQVGPFTVDLKEYRKSIAIGLDMWAKICSDAMRNGDTEPCLKVVLGGGNQKVRIGIVPWYIIEEYMELKRDAAGDKPSE